MRLPLSVPVLLFSGWALAAQPLEIRVVYDNTAPQAGFRADWGFAAVVNANGHRILFDTGTKPDLFMENLKLLEIDPASIECVLISHNHMDHTGGLAPLRARNPRLTVHMPERSGPFEIAPGLWSTGIIEGNPQEQALVIPTARGLVMVTGCSHPGIVKMVQAAQEQRGVSSLRLLLGGFHMLQQDAAQIQSAIASFQRLKVERLMATHCTGDLPVKLFKETFGPRFESAGAGKRIVLE
jgi:7,8-dihydropterin-6-yl-methyl-4-(beta-D-ribofuranosyl)aminobenzene 5'-phosphate synthase